MLLWMSLALVSTTIDDGAGLEPDDNVLRVRFRVDGRLHEKISPPYHMTPAVVSRVKIMAALDISERRAPQDGGISVMVNKNPVDLRVSIMPGKFGEKIVWIQHLLLKCPLRRHQRPQMRSAVPVSPTLQSDKALCRKKCAL